MQPTLVSVIRTPPVGVLSARLNIASRLASGESGQSCTMPLQGYISTDGPYTGLTKDQLLECAYRPVWVRVRCILLVAYWVSWVAMLVGAITLVVVTPKCTAPETLQWWQLSPIYQIYPLSYQDGRHPPHAVGDISGIESRLDYIKDLGVGAVWLSPIYKSPMKDFGYDIQDFRDIAPVFGTMDDFCSLSKAMKERGIKLLLDFVPNHSSDLHEWFQKSIKREAPYTDYYMWVDANGFETDGRPIPPNNWRSAFGGSAWEWNQVRQQFYLHQFLKEQPDLNYRNPLVLQEMKSVMQFWLDKGVDGFRVDAVAHLFEDEALRDEPMKDEDGIDEYSQLDHMYTFNLPEVLDVLQEFRILLDKNSENGMKILLTEAYLPVDELMEYYGNKSRPIAHFPFNFELLPPRLKNISAQSVHDAIKNWMDNIPEGAWPNWVIGNHDNSRVATRFGSELVDAMNMITLLLPGTPVTYNGEEIGMEDVQVSWEETKDTAGINSGPVKYRLFSRDPERSPMQWSAGKNAGFSTANQTWLPVNPNYRTLNVEAQLDAKWSHIKVYKLLAGARKAEAIMNGELVVQVLEDSVLVYTRKRISNSAVLLPGKGGVVLTFVPEFLEEPIPL